MILQLVNKPLLARLSPVALHVAKASLLPAATAGVSRLAPAARYFSQVAKMDDDGPAHPGHVTYKDPFQHPFFTKGFDDFFNVSSIHYQDSPFDLTPIFSSTPLSASSMLRVASPGFEIHEGDDKYSIAIDLPDIKAEDMEVRLENDGRVLHVSGGKMIDDGEEVRETRFDKRFSIGKNVDLDKMTANLKKGVLVVSAPKNEVVEEEPRKIAITEG